MARTAAYCRRVRYLDRASWLCRQSDFRSDAAFRGKNQFEYEERFSAYAFDAATSLIVAALGVLWLFKPWFWLDPLFSWMIVALILYGGWGLLKESVLILMNATPSGIDLNEIQQALMSIKGVKKIHDLHVWNPSAESIALAVHVTVDDQMLSQVDKLAEKAREILLTRFNIDHPILQFECNSCDDARLLCSGKNRPYHNQWKLFHLPDDPTGA